ncbi:MAG: RNA-binding cell elongation regulator Jag/EloR, partial [Chloroflexota bacterium]
VSGGPAAPLRMCRSPPGCETRRAAATVMGGALVEAAAAAAAAAAAGATPRGKDGELVANGSGTGGGLGEVMSQAPARTVEVSAKSVDEAVSRALEQLGCTRDEAEVEVLHPGSPGRLLGFGAEPARVRVTLPAEGLAGQIVAGAAGAPAFPVQEAEAAAEAEAAEVEEAAEAAHEGTLAGDADFARLMLAELLDRMGIGELRVEVVSSDPLQLNIRGGDVADLIGRRGENLRALQFVLSLMLNKQLRRHVRVIVDADGYRARREELLMGMAQRFAHRVRATRQPMQLEAMPPNERRIIHLALTDDPDIATESIGEGDARRVVIKPRR